MGLFGSSKKQEAATVKIDYFFTPEALAQVRQVLESKFSAGAYGIRFSDEAKYLLEATKDPDRIYDKKEVRKLIYSAGVMTKVDPSIEPALQTAIDKFKATKNMF